MQEETTGLEQAYGKFNLGRLPPEGSEQAGRFFKKMWEDAKHEKIQRLKLHLRWMDLHKKFRGQYKQSGAYPVIGINYLFKTIQGFAAMLTEKQPKAEFVANNPEEKEQVKALDVDTQKWWVEKELQNMLYASVMTMAIYGTTIEKFGFDRKDQTSKVILRDPFNFFPAPGYKLCDMSLPYCCDAYFLDEWEIKDIFDVPENVKIPSDADEQLFGTRRETVRGGRQSSIDTTSNLPSNYSDTTYQSEKGRTLDGKTLVVEIWIRDNSTKKVPIMEEIPVTDDMGRPVPIAKPETIKTGEWEQPNYPGGIRKITLCPALLNVYRNGVLDDQKNPNINWNMVDLRFDHLKENGLEMPVMDEAGQPVIDPNTQQPLMQAYQLQEEEAWEMAINTVKDTFLFDNFPYSAIPFLIDTTQWWGFSALEQLEEMQGKAEMLLTRYFAYFDRLMFPIMINPSNSGVDNSQITDEPGLVLNPTPESVAYFTYLQSPSPPQGLLELLQFVLMQMDVISMTPEVSEGRRPKGVSAASAIIALQDKASTLVQPFIRAVDRLIRNRGRAHGSMVQNFGTKEKPIMVDDEMVKFLGTDIMGGLRYSVESGSSAPITKAGRRQQYIELFRIGAMSLRGLLEMLEIPHWEHILEELTEQQSVPGAIDILIQAGLPEELAQQVYTIVMQNQGGAGVKAQQQSKNKQPNPNDKGMLQRQPTGPGANTSEGLKAAFSQMDLVG